MPVRAFVSSADALILIVEDHDDTRFMLRTLFQLRGMGVVEAEDGEAGVRVAEEVCPDMILMDMNLPRLNGLAATQLIRESKTLSGVPVVILSGDAAPPSQTAAFAAGCSDYLVKPLDFGQLDRILQQRLALHVVSAAAGGKRVNERNIW
ncbi:MAG TPA: response regulator [Pyrinomonadaceae bacterium]|nr:response regulator [Pyrinomonadaceae bacterium]